MRSYLNCTLIPRVLWTPATIKTVDVGTGPVRSPRPAAADRAHDGRGQAHDPAVGMDVLALGNRPLGGDVVGVRMAWHGSRLAGRDISVHPRERRCHPRTAAPR